MPKKLKGLWSPDGKSQPLTQSKSNPRSTTRRQSVGEGIRSVAFTASKILKKYGTFYVARLIEGYGVFEELTT